jgi:hypothetical protein
VNRFPSYANVVALCLYGYSVAVSAACAVGLTPARVAASTFPVFTEHSQGTAFSVGDGVAVTAGHVCAAAAFGADHSMFARIEDGYDGLSLAVPAVLTGFERSETPGADVCVILVRGAPPPIPLAAAEPAPGTPDGASGYPGGVKETSGGVYLGHGVTASHVDHGSSGGPVFTRDGVYGVVTQLTDEGLGAVTPVAELRRVLKRLGVRPEAP